MRFLIFSDTFTLVCLFIFTSTCIFTGLATVVFFLYWGHCECLASLVGPVRVLSADMIFMKLFYEQIK